SYYHGEKNDLFLKPGEVGAAYVTDIVYKEHTHNMREIEQPALPGSTKTHKMNWFKSLVR
ncbi:MAG: hypothetical protein POG24_02760, partial [Acidocella sp.]|nr:hypothetical protein [Acidocella sp.]